MDESVSLSIRSRARFFIDEAHAFRFQLREHSLNVIHFKANVMHPRAAFGKILRNA